MALLLDDVQNMKLYRTKFYMPIDKKDRKCGSVVFLLTKNLIQSMQLMKNDLFINNYSFISYYLERDIAFYINEMMNLEPIESINESLTKKERDSIDKSDFGIPEDKKYPLDTEEHVKSAIKLFGHAEEDKKHKLAKRIKAAASKYGIEINKDTEVDKYLNEYEMLEEQATYEVVSLYKHIADNTSIIDEDGFDANVEGRHFRVFFDEAVDKILNEGQNHKLRRLLYQDRIKTQKEQIDIYDRVKVSVQTIKKTYIKLDLYHKLNLFVDMSYYLGTFFKNNIYRLDVGIDLFVEMLARSFNDGRLTQAGYDKKTVFVDLRYWAHPGEQLWDYKKNPTPMSAIFRYIKRRDKDLIVEKLGQVTWVFMTDTAYFKCDINEIDNLTLPKFMNLIKRLVENDISDAEMEVRDSPDALVLKVVDRLSQNGIEIRNLTGGTKEISKEELAKKLRNATAISDENEDEKKAAVVQQIMQVANNASSEDDVYKLLDNDINKEWLASLINDLQADDGGININKTRAARMSTLNADIMRKELNGKSIKDYIEQAKVKPIPTDTIPIKSMNEEWKDVKFSNFSSTYNLDDDVVSIFTSMIEKSEPLSIISIDKEDKSTSEDYVEKWTVKFEDVNGKRFTVNMDVPKFVDGRFMKLRGNLKTIQGQLMLLPIIKTDENTAQIVTNYNKIFVRRMNPSNGSKTTKNVSKITNILNKYKGNKMKVYPGDNSFICSKYELPIEFADLAGQYSKIEFEDGSYISFNVEQMTDLAKKKNKNEYDEARTYFYYDAHEDSVWGSVDGIGRVILDVLNKHAYVDKDEVLTSLLETTKGSDKLSYTSASIMNAEIPTIIVMAYSEGLQKAMTKGGVEYSFQETRPKAYESFIKFKDGYIVYKPTIEASLLMSGLSKSDTDLYSIKDINKKEMWTDFLEDYGGRIKADGLDNFYDLMVDPITKEICELYKLPSDYIEMLGYASALLADTKYNKHVDITGNRIRTNEIVAGYVYKVIATAYGEYKNQLKRNKNSASLSIKPSAVIDAVMLDPTMSDLSISTPLLEAEAANAVTFKGLSGLNSERSYTLEKRTFDESMLGVLGLSTGFAGNVGVTRQATINAEVLNSRGLIKKTSTDKLNTLNTLTIGEALSPFSTTHDDPIRSAMNFIQSTKHQMRVKRSHANLCTTGMDEALPYMTSNIFSYKFKGKRGKVVDVTDEWIIFEDLDTKQRELVSLKESVMKNSDGGFYVTVKLSSNVRKGQSLAYNDILAFDKTCYSKALGTEASENTIAYNTGTLAKIAIATTDEGYEDSAIISESLADSLTTEYVVRKERYLPKEANIYNVVTPGTPIEEGDPLMIFQNAFEEKDANALLKAITDEEIEAISDLGRIHVRSKLTGIVQDVKIYRTCELDELSPSLKKLVMAYEKKIKEKRNKLSKLNVSGLNTVLDADYKLEPVGNLKGAPDGVMIEFYLKCTDKMGIGDKLVYSAALKGVIKDIFKEGEEPTTDFRPDEYVEGFITTSGVNARMVSSIIINGLINKGIIELTRKCQEHLGIKWKYLYDMEANVDK